MPRALTRSTWRRPQAFIVIALSAASVVYVSPAAGQQPGQEPVYRVPDQVLVDIVDAPPTPAVLAGPSHEWLLIGHRPALPAIAELAERELRLAGIRMNPRVSGRSRTSYFTGIAFLRLADASERAVTGLPARPRIEHVTWSPDGRRVAFTNTAEGGIGLWVADVATGAARRLVGPRLNLTVARGPAWLADSRTLVTALVPEGRGTEPEAPGVPSGPVIRENIGKTAPAWTYQDLLENPHDERLFEHYATAQLAKVTLDGTVTPIGPPGIIWDFEPSPDGRFVLLETLHRPFSYLVPASRFPRTVEVVDLSGRRVHLVAELALQEGVPTTFGSVPTGPRNVSWRADAPATLAWAEAQDGGDAGRPAEVRDKLFVHTAPFSGGPRALATLSLRYGEVLWGTDNTALVYERWWKTRREKVWRVRPGEADAEPELVWDRSYEDRYGDPGHPDTRRNAWGRSVMLTREGGNVVFLIGQGASPKGERPFLDRFDLRTRQATRLFRSEAPYYEQPVAVLDDRGDVLLTRRESASEPPNYFVRDLRRGTIRPITTFLNPTPQLAGMRKELIQYERADGVKLSGTLYLPSGYQPADGPLPTLMWAYPREYRSADAAGQVADSPYRFDRLSGWSTVIWLTQGYAVLDGPTMPIVGEGDAEPNDSYVEQLVASAQAAVDEVVRRGVAARGRIAIGGHSYGAFMAANLLIHSDLFVTGIARSGAYNRSLTPFGFQREERTLWQAPEVYFRMSPFMNADRLNEPILLIHGEADNNAGTWPIQSERFYEALKGLGKAARLVMLPDESHGYRARESVLHMLWETQEWLARYLKGGVAERASGRQ